MEDADKAYVEKGFMRRMAEFGEHKRVVQMEIDVTGLKLDVEVLEIDTSSPNTAENGKLVFGARDRGQKESGGREGGARERTTRRDDVCLYQSSGG